jgi:hypothetical protein
MATANKAIAQHRDIRRYEQRRSGHYLPRLYTFKVGDLVYCETRKGDTLQTKAAPIILRVIEVRDSGVLMLQGRDGKVKAVHSSQVAPCHLAGIDTTLDAELQFSTGAEQCQICHSPSNARTMIMCDSCFTGWHMACLTPPLQAVPKGVWICPNCDAAGLSRQQVMHRSTAGKEQDQRLQQMRKQFLTPAAKKAEAKSAKLQGRLCQRFLPNEQGDPSWTYARLHYRGVTHRPRSLLLIAGSGDYEELSLRTLQQLIKVGLLRMLDSKTQLPAGVQIPEPLALHTSHTLL